MGIGDFVAITISFLALVISLYTTVRHLYVEKFNIEVDFIKWFGGNENGDFPFFLWLTISNESKIPCSIISVELEVENNRELKAVGKGAGKIVYESNNDKISSLSYPVNIDGYMAVSGYFHFKGEHPFYNFEGHEIELIIKTTRGNLKKKIKLTHDNNVFRIVQREDMYARNILDTEDLYQNCLSKYHYD